MKYLSVLLITLSALALTGCGDDKPETAQKEKPELIPKSGEVEYSTPNAEKLRNMTPEERIAYTKEKYGKKS